MTPEEFNVIVDRRLAICRSVLCDKGREYSRGEDRLHNFKTAGQRRGITPERALDGMMLKHDVSIGDMISDAEKDPPVSPQRETMGEKITDAINYLLLLEGLLTERIDNQRKWVHVDPVEPQKD